MAAATVVGRADERGLLTDLVRGARDGRFGAVVIEGDAGIGKTTLVREACAAAGDDALVLPGACLPLTSVAVPLLGLRSGVRALSAAERPVCLGGLRGGSGPVPVAFDEWLAGECSQRPVVLVVDDLHWADGETLDALTYVLAGPENRRLAVILTVRSTDVGPRHPLQRWLADARRLPRVREVVLGPMSRDEVAEEVGLVFGGAAHTSLVDEVFTRSGGNPYFVRLLVSGLRPSDRSLPAHLPEQLSAAAVGGWALLSAAAKRFTVVLAVGGRPAAGESLDRVVALAGITESNAVMHEAVDAGLVDLAPDGSIWFHHPLQAEVLEQELLPEERRVLHSGFAAEYARQAGDSPTAELTETVSDHHLLAGNTEQARAWAMRAAREMQSSGNDRGRLRMLRRVADCVADAPVSRTERIALLEDLRDAAAGVADWAEELDAVEVLLECLDPGEDAECLSAALRAAERWELRFALARGPDSADMEPALAATKRFTGSAQRRHLLATYASALVWEDRVDDARAALEEAFGGLTPEDVAAGHDLPAGSAEGSVGARAWCRAFVAACFLAGCEGDPARGRRLGARAAELALECQDPRAFVSATFHTAISFSGPGDREGVEDFARHRQQLEEAGGPSRYVGWLSAAEASNWFLLGEVERCEERLRVALGSDPGPTGDVYAREVSALLACGQGRLEEAQAHLARAEELGTVSVLHINLAKVRATVRGASGDLEGAVEAALADADSGKEGPPWYDWRLPLAARALADLAERDRADGGDPTPHLTRLEAVVARAPHVIPSGYGGSDYASMVSALDGLYRAEVARAFAEDEEADTWVSATEALGAVGLPWDETYASWRAAGALLRRGSGADRRGAATRLRRGHWLAVRLGAEPLRTQLESVARAARIPLTAVPGATTRDGTDPLTRREREVLAHVVAGRTYAEIAAALFLSEKTVSSHISNMLRKTAAANRVELAAWAQRSAG
ncbi:MAG: AAA family ATPase [Ornithinibacter sp.]